MIATAVRLIGELQEAVELMSDRPLEDADDIAALRVEAAAAAWDSSLIPSLEAGQARQVCSLLDAAKRNVSLGGRSAKDEAKKLSKVNRPGWRPVSPEAWLLALSEWEVGAWREQGKPGAKRDGKASLWKRVASIMAEANGREVKTASVRTAVSRALAVEEKRSSK